LGTRKKDKLFGATIGDRKPTGSGSARIFVDAVDIRHDDAIIPGPAIRTCGQQFFSGPRYGSQFPLMMKPLNGQIGTDAGIDRG